MTAAAALLVWATLHLIGGSADSAEPAILTAEDPIGSAPGQLPVGVARSDEPAPTPLDAEASGLGSATPGGPLTPDEYEHVTILGRLSGPDGRAPGTGLAVSASLRRPDPEITVLRDVMGESGAEPFSGSFGGMSAEARGEQVAETAPAAPKPHRNLSNERLQALTYTEVAPDGTFALENVPARGAYLRVHHDLLYADPPVRVSADSGTIDVNLVLGAHVVGTTTDEQGRPIADVSVSAGSRFDPWMVFDGAASMVEMNDVDTDEAGRFDLRQVPAGVSLLVFAFPSKGTLQHGRLEIGELEAGQTREVTLTLTEGSTILGRVVDADGNPVPRAEVAIRRTDFSLTQLSAGMEDEMFSDDGRTETDGSFRFEGLADGNYSVVLDDDDYRPKRVGPFALGPELREVETELVAEAGLSLTGLVLDPDGEPIEGASVTAGKPPSMTDFMDMQAMVERQTRRSARTNEQGRFELTGFDEGRYEVKARRHDFIGGSAEVTAGGADVVLTLERTAAVSGIVVSTADGEPVAEFSVRLMPAGGLFDMTDPFGFEERAGRFVSQTFAKRQDGTFDLQGVQAGEYDLSVRADGFGRALLEDVEVGSEGRRGLVVMLPPEAIVTGWVVGARDGMPIEGAEVSTGSRGVMDMVSDTLTGGAPSAYTDAEGSFRLGELERGEITLTVTHASFRELALEPVTLSPGEERELGAIRLKAGGAVYGRVLDEYKRPMEGIIVLVSDATGMTMKRDTSDEDGNYRVEGLPAGTYNVMRMDFSFDMGGENSMDFMKDMVLRTVSLVEEEEKEVDLAVDSGEGTRLHGTVSSSDGPAASAFVTIVPENGNTSGMNFSSTNAKGEYELTVREPGAYALQVVVLDGSNMSMGGQPSSPVIETITVGGAPEQRHDVRLAGGVMNGVVESAATGKPISGVRVLLQRTDAGLADVIWVEAMGGRVGETYTGEDGSFRFRFLPPGTYDVVAGGTNMLGMGASGWATTRVSDISVGESGSGFTVRVAMGQSGTVSGIVKDLSGAGLPNVGIWARDADGQWLATFSEIASDSGGGYELTDLEPGTWTLAFRSNSHALTLVPGVVVRAGETTDLDVSLPPGVTVLVAAGDYAIGSLDLVLEGPGGPIPTELTSLQDMMAAAGSDTGLPLGTFVPGTYHVTILSDGQVVYESSLTLSAAESSHLITITN